MKSEMFRRFYSGTGGVAAIEAALLFPFLVLLFVGAMETLVALDARRAVNNASFSLANAAAASRVIDGDLKALLRNGHDAIIGGAALSDGNAALLGYESFPDGTVHRIWSWQLGNGNITMTEQEIQDAIMGNVVPGEGLVVSIVEARHTTIFDGLSPSLGFFRGFYAQVPTKISVPIYR